MHPRPVRICYFVHDLGDAAVHRRVRMLQEGGATVTLVGFRRAGVAFSGLTGVLVFELGETEDARLARRCGSVLLAAIRLSAVRLAVCGADIIIARQLETLVLAAAARRRFVPGAPLVFECLDIHRMMIGSAPVHAVLRRLEGWLLQRCALLIVSSPAFVARHFSRYRALPPVRLIENKGVCVAPSATTTGCRRGLRQPWRIGWFGVLRCRRSLTLLAELVRAQGGRVEVILRGRPAYSAIPDFDRIMADVPGLRYGGPYDGATELRTIYESVDFTWAIDFFEAGANSGWLLPNRLYEGGLHGSVPLALRATETGRWLATHGAGVLFDEPLAEPLDAFFAHLTPTGYAALPVAVPLRDLVHDTADCERLVTDLGALRQHDQAARRSRVSTSMAA